MKRILYVGIYSDGTTSKMRADILRSILTGWEFQVIDTDIPKRSMPHLWQSVGFRYKIGPLINKVNQYVLDNIGNKHYDLIWVDKAIYLTKATTQLLRSLAGKLVHYTPDPAFTFHKSHLFYKSLPLYDFAVTTKRFELQHYLSFLKEGQVLYATQGFDRNVHHPVSQFENKKGVCFLGHYEEERGKTLQMLIDNGIDVTLAGINWGKFVARNNNNLKLQYLGIGVYGEAYVRTLSSACISWGSLSKWIPELHTTRTFEIPACGTALLTERNEETMAFFNEDEAIFYSSEEELLDKVKYYLTHKDALRQITENGHNRVLADGRDYESIMRKILQQIL